MNIILAVVIYFMMITLMAFSVYQDPQTLGIGLVLFLTGIPVFYITNFMKNWKPVIKLLSKAQLC